MSVRESIVGASDGVRVPLHWTPSSFLMAFAGAAMFVESRPLPLSRVVTVRVALAGALARVWMLVAQRAAPVLAGIVVGEQVCVSVTVPCFLLNATGIVTGLRPFVCGSSVIRPKYCPFATSGALIV